MRVCLANNSRCYESWAGVLATGSAYIEPAARRQRTPVNGLNYLPPLDKVQNPKPGKGTVHLQGGYSCLKSNEPDKYKHLEACP